MKKKLSISTKTIITLFLLLFNKTKAFAQTTAQAVKTQGISNPVIGNLGTNDASTSSGSKFVQYTVYLWRSAITIGSLAVIVFFLLGAFTWITSGGDKTKVEEARNKITNAIIGLVLLVSSFVLLSFLSKILFGGEFDLLQLTIPGTNN